jgi:glucosamine--fructose-6-phosphate aminotransferase (isomerizing)
VLKQDAKIQKIAEKLYKAKSLLVMGRGYNYATCMEGALKIKELTYVHCEGIQSGELKHGPLALVDEDIPIIQIVVRDRVYDKCINALEQVKSRKGNPILICEEGDEKTIAYVPKHGDYIEVPKTVDALQGILTVIPMQLISYHMAVLKGCNVDQPRNLAKSVTVE